MKENEDFITHFPFTPLPAHAPQIACVCMCECFCTGKLTKCASRFPDRLAYAHTLAQGCSLEKSLTQLETCGEMPKVWNIYTLPGIVVCLCVCMHARVCMQECF